LPFEGNLMRHVSLFHFKAVAFDAWLSRTGVEDGGRDLLPIGHDGHAHLQVSGHVPPQGAGARSADAHASAEGPAADFRGCGGEDACSHYSDDQSPGANMSGSTVVVRGALSARRVRLSRVRHVFQGTTAALVYRYFLGIGDMTRAQPLIPLHRQGRPTSHITEAHKAIRLSALSKGGKGMSEKARVDYYNSVAQAEAVTAASAATVIEEMDEPAHDLVGRFQQQLLQQQQQQ